MDGKMDSLELKCHVIGHRPRIYLSLLGLGYVLGWLLLQGLFLKLRSLPPAFRSFLIPALRSLTFFQFYSKTIFQRCL